MRAQSRGRSQTSKRRSSSAVAQAKKDKLISELIETRGRILGAASWLSPEQRAKVFLGIWSAQDLLAHLVGWDFANMAAVKEILDGELPSFYAHYDRDWKTFNARLVAKYKKDDWAELVSLVIESHRKLIELLKTVPAEEFDNDGGLRFRGYKVTIASVLQAEASDEKTHHTQIRKLTGRASRGTRPRTTAR